jgi:hypothetical protein
MEEWGKPQRIRVDNGRPWGRANGLPMALALWLMGLGIEVTWIPPRRPQRNGVVERTQGVLQQWAEPKRWKSIEEGQKRLDWAVAMQREEYRGRDGKTRRERFPELGTNPRRYTSEAESEEWSLGEVDRRLATGTWGRRVGKTGQIYLYGWAYTVGRACARQHVFVSWNGESRRWRVRDAHGQEIKMLDPKHFDAEAICSLEVTYVKPSRERHK